MPAFPLRYRRPELGAAQVRERTAEVLRLVHLDAFADRPAPALSGGQQQRLALARALISDPKVLLLDEPLSNLDARLREEMRFELRALTKRLGVTTILVTHEQAEALSLADVVAVMDDGRFMQISSPRELYDRPRTEFVAGFVGRANLIPAEVIAIGIDGSPQWVSVSTPVRRRRVLYRAPAHPRRTRHTRRPTGSAGNLPARQRHRRRRRIHRRRHGTRGARQTTAS